MRMLTFDNESVFGISEDAFLSTGLKVGDEVDEVLLQHLEQKGKNQSGDACSTNPVELSVQKSGGNKKTVERKRVRG